jgi:prepilin-type N-terminal cleavage/methylation domain-containing protein
VAIRPPQNHSQGFTLIEMIVTVMVAGIIAGIALPSFLSLSKPLRDGSLQFKSQISLIRSKAIASGKAYRIRPKFDTRDDYPDGIVRSFVVEYAKNCKVLENGDFPPVTPPEVRWQMASQFDLDLPPNIGIPNTPTSFSDPEINDVSTSLDWIGDSKRICFDNRGILDDTTTKIILKDFQGFNKAKIAAITITKVGEVDVNTYSENFTRIVKNGTDDPDF